MKQKIKQEVKGIKQELEEIEKFFKEYDKPQKSYSMIRVQGQVMLWHKNMKRKNELLKLLEYIKAQQEKTNK